MPALLMFGGIMMHGVSSGVFLDRFRIVLPGPSVTPWPQGDDPRARFRSSEVATSLGLLAFALVPAITVCLILPGHLRGRWSKAAAVAAAVVPIMAFSAILGKK